MTNSHRLFAPAHVEEERLRTKSLETISRDDDLTEEFQTIEYSIKLLVNFTQEYKAQNDEEGMFLHFAIRTTNFAFAAIKLLLSGYYQQSLALARDFQETANLLYLFILDPEKGLAWRSSNKSERLSNFSPVKVRIKLEELEKVPDVSRKKVYSEVSELANHATARGFNFLLSDKGLTVGPFFQDHYMRTCIRELFLRLCPTVHLIGARLTELPQPLRDICDAYSTHFIELARRLGTLENEKQT